MTFSWFDCTVNSEHVLYILELADFQCRNNHDCFIKADWDRPWLSYYKFIDIESNPDYQCYLAYYKFTKQIFFYIKKNKIKNNFFFSENIEPHTFSGEVGGAAAAAKSSRQPWYQENLGECIFLTDTKLEITDFNWSIDLLWPCKMDNVIIWNIWPLNNT